MSKKNDLEHTSTTFGNQDMKGPQRMVSVVEPYELPEGWKWETLEKLCFIPITDGTHQTPTYSDSDSGIPFISSKDVTKEFIDWSNIKYITKELHSELYKRVAPQIDDILLAKNGTTGVAAIVDTDKIFDIYVTLALIRPNKEIILPRFLLQVINSPICKNQFDEHLTGIGVPNLHLRDIRTTMIPLPPTLAEQQRIVNRIESMFAKLDEAKEKAQKVVDSFETRKAAILHKAFTGELTAKWRKENGVSDDSWVVKTIGECGKWERGRSKHRPRNAPELFGGRYPFIQTGDIANADIYIYEHKQTLSEFGFQQSRLFPKDTLCITIAANIGKVAILTYDCCFPDSVVGFTPFENVNSKFMYYKINDMQKDLEAMAPATAQKNLNLKLLTSVSVQIPTLPEQVEIVRILDIIIEKENKAKQAAEAVLEQIDLLKKSILARAFRGEL